MEGDDPSELVAEIENMQSRFAHDPGYSYYFIKGIFLQLKKLHEKVGLRTAVYSEDQGTYKLGFSEYRAMGLNVDFEKRLDGWIIRDTYLTRANHQTNQPPNDFTGEDHVRS